MTDENKNDESNNDLETKLADANKRIEQAEIKLTKILKNEKRSIPEEFHGLIPDNLSLEEQINWIQSCREKGFFKDKVESIDTKKPSDKKPTDLSNLNPHQMMAKGYRS